MILVQIPADNRFLTRDPVSKLSQAIKNQPETTWDKYCRLHSFSESGTRAYAIWDGANYRT